MKIVIISFIFVLTSAFSFNISAQEKANINKSDEILLSLKEKLTKLKLLVSTKKDVRKVFGKKNCSELSYCYFNKDWSIHIQYVFSQVGKELDTQKTIYYQPRSKELVGKVSGISAVASNTTLPDSFVSSENLKCVKTVTYFGNDNKSNSRVCSDNQGLVYLIYDEIMWYGKLQKNVLAAIQYFLPAEEYNKIFVLDYQ
jgi:hypothetical protein